MDLRFDITKAPSEDEIIEFLHTETKKFNFQKRLYSPMEAILILVLTVGLALNFNRILLFFDFEALIPYLAAWHFYLLGSVISCINFWYSVSKKFSEPRLERVAEGDYMKLMKMARDSPSVKAYLKDVSTQERDVCCYEKNNLSDYYRTEMVKNENEKKKNLLLEEEQQEAQQKELAVQGFRDLGKHRLLHKKSDKE